MQKTKILITGASGLIGSRIIEMLSFKYDFIPVHQAQCDITDASSTQKYLSSIDFDMIVHLAAYTNVDGAEKEHKLCQEINVDGTRNLFNISQQKDVQMIHISTDFVFDGRRQVTPVSDIISYTEDSIPNPISFYGQTKLEAEQIVKGQAMIIRTSYPYRKIFEQKRDFVRSIKYLLEQGKVINMVQDSLITPTYIDDFVNGLDYLIQNFTTKIYHLVGSDSMSPYEAGITIAKTFGLNADLIFATTYDKYFENKALRPQWAKIISTEKIDLSMSTFAEGLKKLLD